MTAPGGALTGHTVLVTRPSHQAAPLCRLIEAAGGTALAIPALEIVPRRDADARGELETVLGQADIAVFVSVNAVEQALALLKPERLPGSLTPAAVGRSTAEALKARGYTDVTHPREHFDSEGLMQTPLFRSVRDRTVAIVRGEGGREWLADRLREAGARVTPVAVYRRSIPEHAGPALREALAGGRVSLLLASSNAGLDNLLSMAGERHAGTLRAVPAVVLSDRTQDFARRRGFHGPIEVAARADNENIVAALTALATRISRR